MGREQFEVVKVFLGGKDMFVALPTGSGKSICFSCLPLVFDTLRATGGMSSHHSIVLVVLSQKKQSG